MDTLHRTLRTPEAARYNQVIMMNAAVYAMKVLQSSMKDEAEKVGLRSDQDVAEMIMEMRAKENE